MVINVKPFDQMSLAELRHERALWDDRITHGVFAGHALALALTSRNLCAGWIARREMQAMGAAA